MSRLLAAASALLVVAGSWSVSAQQTATVPLRAFAKRIAPKLLPGTRSDVLSTIQGNAFSSTNAPLPNTLVRLRDARFGRVVDTLVTDASGTFAFKAVDPGSYIVELMRNDQTLLATSQIINVNAGELVSAVIQLPMGIAPFAGVLGSSSTSAAALLATQAAASGIAAAIPTSPVSPNQ